MQRRTDRRRVGHAPGKNWIVSRKYLIAERNLSDRLLNISQFAPIKQCNVLFLQTLRTPNSMLPSNFNIFTPFR